MAKKSNLPYGNFDGVKIVELPYQSVDKMTVETLDSRSDELDKLHHSSGRKFSMLVILPEKFDGLPSVESNLIDGKLDGWIHQMEIASVNVMLPKFTLSARLNLKEVLYRMGIRTAFGRKADLSGIGDDLIISEASQSAKISVNEEGSIASAVFSWGFSLSLPPQEVEFRADHPFVFVIRDNRTGCILFFGRVVNPRDL